MTSTDSASASVEQTTQTPSPVSESDTKTEEILFESFMKIDLRVGEIVAAEALPKSKKLLKLQVSLGETLGQRQILAGIAQHYQADELVGKRIIVVSNLKPAKLMGHESQGMLLAASPDDDSVVSIVAPPTEVPLGSRVR
jgi:methionyl-tRNA synthetase